MNSKEILANIQHNKSIAAKMLEQYLRLTTECHNLKILKEATWYISTSLTSGTESLEFGTTLQLLKQKSDALHYLRVESLKEYNKLTKSANNLLGQLVYNALFVRNNGPEPSVQMLWKLVNFRPQTKIDEICWVDPLEEVNRRFSHCVLYLKYLRTPDQVSGLHRVVETLLVDKQIKYLEIKHYVDNDTEDRVKEAKKLIGVNQALTGKVQNITWSKKNRDEYHMRRIYFYTPESRPNPAPALTIVCDRDFIDIGDPARGSREVNFLYIKPYENNPPEGWKSGFHIEAAHSNTGCEMRRFLEVIFDGEAEDEWSNVKRRHLGDTIEMSFRHTRVESPQRQLHSLVQFCQKRGVKTVHIKTMLNSEMSEQKKKLSPEEKKRMNEEEIAQQKKFVEAYDNMNIIFDTNMKRFGDHSNSIHCPQGSIRLISDEGLQFFKGEDCAANLQRPRAFSLFVLYL